MLGPTARLPALHRPHNSRSPSRSPTRRQQFYDYELDPLLSNLSPSSTLDALSATDAVPADVSSHTRLLQESIAGVSKSSRALGIRAALAGKKFKEWFKELEDWEWPDRAFQVPTFDAKRAKAIKRAGLTHFGHLDQVLIQSSQLKTEDETHEVYWGCLPAPLVLECEDRVETIRDEMEELQVEQLKAYVRDVHISRSRPSSASGPEEDFSPAVYRNLDDFTALITATIMHALPYLSRLNSLLNVWSVRFLVLRKVPGFLRGLEELENAMRLAWRSIKVSATGIDDCLSSLSRAEFVNTRSLLENKVSRLAQRLDEMLDILEGHNDTIPETWIDSLESIETTFGDWVVQAEKQLLRCEWQAQQKNADPESDFGIYDTGELFNKQVFQQAQSFSDLTPFRESPRDTEYSVHVFRSSKDRLENVNTNDNDVSHSLPSQNHSSEIAKRREFFNNSQVSSAVHDAQDSKTDAVENTLQRLLETETETETEIAESSTSTDESKSIPVSSNALVDSSRCPSTLLPPYVDNQTEGILVPDEVQGPDNQIPTQQSSGQKSDGMDYLIFSTPGEPEHLAESYFPKFDFALPSKDKKPRMPNPKGLSLNRPSQLVEGSFLSDTSKPGSASSEYFSNMSSPEILDASQAEYYSSPTQVSTSTRKSREPESPIDTLSRHSSQRTERGVLSRQSHRTSPDPEQLAMQRDWGLSSSPDATVDKRFGAADPTITTRYTTSHFEPQNNARERSDSKHSWSSTSLEASDRNLNSLDDLIAPALEESKEQGTEIPNNSTLPLASYSVQDVSQITTPDKSHPRLEPAFEPDSTKFQSSIPRKSPRKSWTARVPHKDTPAKISRAKDASLGSTHSIEKPRTPSPKRSTEAQLDARISKILSKIPNRIKFTPSNDVDMVETPRSRLSLGPTKSELATPSLRLIRAQASNSSPIALTPGDPNLKISKTQTPKGDSKGDPNIKVYHLHDPTKPIPYKLYVRLVGGSERVMVRVGGGWSDLAEYLSNYAHHHGRRSISDSAFGFQGLPQAQSTSAVTTLASFSSTGQSTLASKPESPMLGSARTSTRKIPRLSSGSIDLSIPSTPEISQISHLDSTKGSLDSATSSVSGSAHSHTRNSWTGEELQTTPPQPLGLAGPKGRRTEISPSKQAWVDGMVDQARKANTENKIDGEWGDLGKVGGTRRLVFRANSRQDGD